MQTAQDLLLRQRSVASIPSKFETVLHQGNQEQNAFWSRTHRFAYGDNELPGPGTYVPAARPGDAPSFSKKGYTGMASKSRRFAIQKRATAPPPGTYDADAGFRALVDKRDFSAALVTGPFAKPVFTTDHSQRKQSKNMTPGPGQYNMTELRRPTNSKAVPFNSGADRFTAKASGSTGVEEEDSSGPGSYDYDAINRQTGAFQIKTGASAAFRSTVKRVASASDRQSDLANLRPHPSMGPSLGIQVDIRGGLNSAEAPGPGYYDPNAADHLLTLDKIRHSSMFSRTNVDRFGKPFVAKASHYDTPGPGYYDQNGSFVPAKAEASHPAFVSTTDRMFGGGGRGAPGPAYYNPVAPSKKSFHLNANRRWL